MLEVTGFMSLLQTRRSEEESVVLSRAGQKTESPTKDLISQCDASLIHGGNGISECGHCTHMLLSEHAVWPCLAVRASEWFSMCVLRVTALYKAS